MKSVKFREDMLIFYDFIQVFVFVTNHYLKAGPFLTSKHPLVGIQRCMPERVAAQFR